MQAFNESADTKIARDAQFQEKEKKTSNTELKVFAAGQKSQEKQIQFHFGTKQTMKTQTKYSKMLKTLKYNKIINIFPTKINRNRNKNF